MLILVAAFAIIITMLFGISILLRRGLNEIIKGLESIDDRLADIQAQGRRSLTE